MDWRESQTLELKVSLAQRDEGLRALCGMVNAEGATGTVAFGVEPNGEVRGLQGDLDKVQRDLGQVIRSKFAPALQVSMDTREAQGKTVLVLQGTRARATPYHEFDGRAYIREGTSTRQLSLQEKSQLRKMRDRDSHNGPWKCDRCGAWTAMFIGVVVDARGSRKSYACSCGGEYWPI